MNIKLGQILPNFGINKTIFISDDQSQDETKSNIKKFIPARKVQDIIIAPVKKVEDIIILSDDGLR